MNAWPIGKLWGFFATAAPCITIQPLQSFRQTLVSVMIFAVARALDDEHARQPDSEAY
jgi:hypothetical protein